MHAQNIINEALNNAKEYITKEDYLNHTPMKLPPLNKVYYDESLILRFYIFLNAMVEVTLTASDKNLPLYIASAKGYAHIATKTIVNNLCSCSGYTEDNPSTTFSKKMIEIVPMLLPFALSNDWRGVEEILNSIVDSLNAKNCLIERGQHEAHIAWFTVKLLSAIFEKEIGRKPIHPSKKKFMHYQSVLDNWNNEDFIEVDKQVSLLCELHLCSEEYHPRDFICFFSVDRSLLLPYEVMIWLKIREYKGLKNPKNFSHPLMQTKIVKKLLNKYTNLPKPKSDPEVKRFLEEKIQQMCPDNDVEIPQWLDSEDTPNTSTEIETNAQSIDTIPDDFMK